MHIINIHIFSTKLIHKITQVRKITFKNSKTVLINIKYCACVPSKNTPFIYNYILDEFRVFNKMFIFIFAQQ